MNILENTQNSIERLKFLHQTQKELAHKIKILTESHKELDKLIQEQECFVSEMFDCLAIIDQLNSLYDGDTSA